MTPDEAVDAVMRGPFEDTHDGERLPPPSPEVERAARRFLRALLARRPLVTFSTHYDAMEGIEVLVGGDGYGVSVSMLNCGWAFLVGPRGKMRGDQTAEPLANVDGLALPALNRLDLATRHEFDEAVK